MFHPVTHIVKALTEDHGQDAQNLKNKFDLSHVKEEWFATNRRTENGIKNLLAELEEQKKLAEIREERLATFHWIKENGDWVVAGDFTDKEEGDEITVMKASGAKQDKIIVRFTEDGNAVVK